MVTLDALAHFRVISLTGMTGYLADYSGWSGIRQVRQALRLADPSVRSPWETRLRMVYVLEAGLPAPLVNCSVYDRRGRLLGIADLLDEEAGLVVEYDGSGHRDQRRHNSDNEREEAFERAGLVVVRVDHYDYRYKRAGMIARLRDGHRRGMLRDRRRDRWTITPPEWATDPFDLLSIEDKEALFGAA